MLRYFLLVVLNLLAFACLALFVLVSPWMLGAWEMWYFWPMTLVLFAGLVFGGLRLLISALTDPDQGADIPVHPTPRLDAKRFLTLAAAWLPFLVYATIRFWQTPVVMDAERIWLLIVTPALLIVAMWLNFSASQARILFGALAVGMVLQAVYGFIAFYVYDDQYVMWAPNLFGYANRAQGSFFCPNHFSGYLELGFCMGVGLLLLPGANAANAARKWWLRKIGAILLMLTTLGGIAISQSRGGWMTVGVVLGAAGLWGLGALSRRTAWRVRLGAVVAVALVVFLALATDNPARRRLYGWHAFNPAARNVEKSLLRDFFERAKLTSRGRMIGGALRAWRSAPVWGIGPGMHQNLWFQFAATDDGDRETGQWPSQANHEFHSYEVHSDWVQLLQEFGIVGLVLFGVGLIPLCGGVLRAIRVAYRRHEPHRALRPLTAWLAIVAIAFHSIGDFNLQIPGVTWTLAALVALGLIPDSRREAS